MIEITGYEGTAEYEAALAIRAAFEELWPGISTSSANLDFVRIAAGAKISGYAVSDIDVVICARFKSGRRFMPRKILKDLAGGRVVNAPVAVQNLLVAVEVKDHPAPNVRVAGDSVSVRYSRAGPVTWKSATDQNIAQLHSLKEYFSDQHIDLFVHRLLIMRGLDQIAANGVLPRNFNGADMLSAIASVSSVAKLQGGYTLRSGNAEMIERALAAPLFRIMVPGSLDRSKMDRIAIRKKDAGGRLAALGSKMVAFRGRGGTGKTVMLLQTAWQAFEEMGKRSLVLTYNHALAADIARLMALLRIPGTAEEGGIAVRTVFSFMFSWFSRLQLIGPDADVDWDQYESLCEAAIDLLDGEAMTDADIEAVKVSDPDKFDFDLVIVDEAQDWPSAEQRLLKRLYQPRQICLADGVDQLVRGARSDWAAGIPANGRQVFPLRRCLRMKANLAVFANAVAEEAGLNWHVEPNDEAAGGRVVLLEGSFAQDPELYRELLRQAKAAGNSEIDFLFCVPPDDVRTSENGRESSLARHFRDQGVEVWDATDEHARRDFPRSPETLRFVQYHSCRGLEGWTVVAERLDLFWRNRLQFFNDGASRDSLRAPGELAAEEAWRWCMMALTRPIDSLVISIGPQDSEPATVLRRVAAQMPDVVELRKG